MAESNVVLRIGSALGPGGFASLQAGIQMIGQLAGKVKESVKELDAFSQQIKRSGKDIASVDRALKGMVDTQQLFVIEQKFAVAQMEVTEAQLTAIGKLAIDFAQRTGTDATSAMVRLTEAIQKGSTRALKPFGIDLENTEDLLLAQAEGIEKVVARGKDLEIEVETLSERFFVFKNNLDTAIGAMYSATMSIGTGDDDGLLSALWNVSDNLGQIGADLLEMPSMAQHFDLAMGAMALSAIGFADEAERVYAVLDRVLKLQRQIDEQKGIIELSQQTVALEESVDSSLEDIRRMQREVAAGTYVDLGVRQPTGGAAKSKGGGGRRAAAPTEDYEFSVAEVYGGTEDLLTGATPGMVGDDVYDTTGIYEYDTALDEVLDTQRELTMTQEEQWTREYEVNQQRLELEAQRAEYMDELRRSEMSAVEAHIDRQLALYQRYYQMRLVFAEEFFGNLAALMALRNKALFTIGKVAAVAQGTVQTILASIDAFRSAMSGLPYPANIIAAPISAAAVGVAGAAMVARIAKTKYGDMSTSGLGGGKGVALGSTGAASGMGANTTGAQSAGSQNSVDVTVVLSPDGERFMDFMVEKNDTRRRHMLPSI